MYRAIQDEKAIREKRADLCDCMDRGLLRSAIAVGFLLVTIFYLGGSLLHLAAPIAVTVSYTLILTRTIPKSQWKEGCKYE